MVQGVVQGVACEPEGERGRGAQRVGRVAGERGRERAREGERGREKAAFLEGGAHRREHGRQVYGEEHEQQRQHEEGHLAVDLGT